MAELAGVRRGSLVARATTTTVATLSAGTMSLMGLGMDW